MNPFANSWRHFFHQHSQVLIAKCVLLVDSIQFFKLDSQWSTHGYIHQTNHSAKTKFCLTLFLINRSYSNSFWLIDRIQIVFDENQWYLFQYLEVSHDISQKLSDSIWWLLRYDCACGRNVDYRIVKSGDIIGLWTIRNEKYLFQL